MATLYFGVNGPTLNVQKDLLIQDTDAPRIMAYLATTDCGFVQEADSNGGIITRVATPEEIAENYAKKVLAELLSATTAHEKAVAAAAAADAVTPITPVG